MPRPIKRGRGGQLAAAVAAEANCNGRRWGERDSTDDGTTTGNGQRATEVKILGRRGVELHQSRSHDPENWAQSQPVVAVADAVAGVTVAPWARIGQGKVT